MAEPDFVMNPTPEEQDEGPATLDDILEELESQAASAKRWRIAFFVLGVLMAIGIARLPSALRDGGLFLVAR